MKVAIALALILVLAVPVAAQYRGDWLYLWGYGIGYYEIGPRLWFEPDGSYSSGATVERLCFWEMIDQGYWGVMFYWSSEASYALDACREGAYGFAYDQWEAEHQMR